MQPGPGPCACSGNEETKIPNMAETNVSCPTKPCLVVCAVEFRQCEYVGDRVCKA